MGGAPRFGSSFFRLRSAVQARVTLCYPDSVFEPQHFGTPDRVSTLIALALADQRDALDDAIEAQVHGPVRLEQDVAALVLDPSFRGTPTEALARRLPCVVEWHTGFRLHVQALDARADYRGAETLQLARAIAQHGWLTPAILGAAARTGRQDAQALKKVWHCLARFGQTADGTGAALQALAEPRGGA